MKNDLFDAEREREMRALAGAMARRAELRVLLKLAGLYGGLDASQVLRGLALVDEISPQQPRSGRTPRTPEMETAARSLLSLHVAEYLIEMETGIKLSRWGRS
jgi:hypothetical protein